MPVQLLAVAWQWPLRKRLPFWYHRRTCRLLGIEIERHGQPSGRHPTLYVANHVSYLDIEVLGALLKASFVAKAEVATWPFFAWLARSEEHTSELQSLMRISYAVFCLKKKTTNKRNKDHTA